LAILANGNLIYNDSMENFRIRSTNQSLTESFIQIVKEKEKEKENQPVV